MNNSVGEIQEQGSTLIFSKPAVGTPENVELTTTQHIVSMNTPVLLANNVKFANQPATAKTSESAELESKLYSDEVGSLYKVGTEQAKDPFFYSSQISKMVAEERVLDNIATDSNKKTFFAYNSVNAKEKVIKNLYGSIGGVIGIIVSSLICIAAGLLIGEFSEVFPRQGLYILFPLVGIISSINTLFGFKLAIKKFNSISMIVCEGIALIATFISCIIIASFISIGSGLIADASFFEIAKAAMTNMEKVFANGELWLYYVLAYIGSIVTGLWFVSRQDIEK